MSSTNQIKIEVFKKNPHYREKRTLPVRPDVEEAFKYWVKYANAAYCNVTNWKCGQACRGITRDTKLLHWFHETSNKAYVAVNDEKKAVIMSFKGTSDIPSVITDSKARLLNYPGVQNAKVHSGFWATYLGTRNETVGFIQKIFPQYRNYTFILTGHSLGGAIAILQLLDLVNLRVFTPRNLITFTYGQPRVGNGAFANYVDSINFPIFRIVNKNDIVPHLPPWTPVVGYRHHSPEFWIQL
ncbi:hypothetical protein G9A89_002345 [Geosiphon pyriformis]|nr:hypothetical protein G9A89_002345 [Geosiphon pyriformis]